MHRVLPAQQRLERHQRAGSQAEDRLVVQEQLVGAERAPQPRLDRVRGRRLADRAGRPRADHAVALGERRELPLHEPVAVDGVLGAGAGGERRAHGRRARLRDRGVDPVGADQLGLGAPDERARVAVGEQHAAVGVERQQRATRPRPSSGGRRRRPASERRSRYCASWPPTVANIADTSGLGSVTPCE